MRPGMDGLARFRLVVRSSERAVELQSIARAALSVLIFLNPFLERAS
jgi:hypothetical protein